MKSRKKIHIQAKLRPQVFDFDLSACSLPELFDKLKTTEKGLSGRDARARLEAMQA